MSARIAENGIITMYAGDYFEAPLFLNIGYGYDPVQYKLEETDKVYFGITEPNQHFTHALVRKELTIADVDDQGRPILVLKPTDTEHLIPGLYYYEVKLLRVKDDQEFIDTVVPRTKIYILE